MTVYFIGGASASGKSTTARKLAEENDYPLLELDQFFRRLDSVVPDEKQRQDATQVVSKELIIQLLTARCSCIVEGGWVKPEVAKELVDKFSGLFHPVFCGYPAVTADERLSKLRSAGKHWLTGKSDSEAIDWLNEQIEGSNWYKNECVKYSFPFIDFSDFARGEAGLCAEFGKFSRK